jgi:hypothetical protein
VMLWLRLTPDEVKVDLDASSVEFPDGTKIPVRADGTLLVTPQMTQRARNITIDELLLAAQQHEGGAASGIRVEDINSHLILARTATNTPDLIAAAIASIQAKTFIRRVSRIFDCVIVIAIAVLSGWLRRFSRIDLVIGAIAFSAAYCLIALGIISAWAIWLPAWLPLGVVWISVIASIILPNPKDSARTLTVAPPPPVP